MNRVLHARRVLLSAATNEGRILFLICDRTSVQWALEKMSFVIRPAAMNINSNVLSWCSSVVSMVPAADPSLGLNIVLNACTMSSRSMRARDMRLRYLMVLSMRGVLAFFDKNWSTVLTSTWPPSWWRYGTSLGGDNIESKIGEDLSK